MFMIYIYTCIYNSVISWPMDLRPMPAYAAAVKYSLQQSAVQLLDTLKAGVAFE